MDNTVKNILLIFLFVLVIYLMSVLSSLLIPLVLALLFSAMFQPFISKMIKSKIPNWIIIPIIVVITLGIFYGLFNILLTSVNQIALEQDYLLQRLSIKMNGIFNWVSDISGITINATTVIDELSSMLNTSVISSAAGGLASGIGSVTSSFLMFALYYMILIGGMVKSDEYIKYIGADKQDSFVGYFDKIQKSIVQYMVLKAVISLTTGTIVFLICWIFDIKFAILWGFLTFILNFIPSIGSIIATLPPVIMAFIEFDELKFVLLLLIILATIQFLIGNVIEPKIMGNRLKLNTVTVIFGLVFWGYIWGIAGMLLSVPLLIIFKLIFEQIPSWSIVARIMGTPPES